jgi:hypothetical protein
MDEAFCQISWLRAEHKVLLILDGHGSHKHLDALEFAKANYIVMSASSLHS